MYLDRQQHDDRRVVFPKERIHKQALAAFVRLVVGVRVATAASVSTRLGASLVDADARREKRRLIDEVGADADGAV